MRRNSEHGNRDILPAFAEDRTANRSGKAIGRTPDMHAGGKSDGRVVPKKSPNKAGPRPVAEAMEERRPTEGNTEPTAESRTLSRIDALIARLRVRKVARRDQRARFTALLHHVTVDLLRESFLALKRQAAPGVDDVT